MRRLALATLVIGLAAAPVWAAGVPDHLKCYKIKDPLLLKGVVDVDTPQFGADPGCTVSKAKLFCVPATKVVQSVEDKLTGPITPLPVMGAPTSDDRVCYKLKCPVLPADQLVTDQFGTRTLDLMKTSYVCTPAAKGTGYCGDGTVNGSEQCDGGDFGGATCQSKGFASGTLTCGNGCQLDTSGCVATVVCNILFDSISASWDAGNVLVSWTVSVETLVSQYTVQSREPGGFAFIDAASIPATNAGSYSVSVPAGPTGTIYRVRASFCPADCSPVFSDSAVPPAP